MEKSIFQNLFSLNYHEIKRLIDCIQDFGKSNKKHESTNTCL